MRPKAILFDLDDTLISHQLHRTNFWRDSIKQSWAEKFGDFVDFPKDIEDLVNKINNSAIDFWSKPERHKIGRLDIATARFKICDYGLGSDLRFDTTLKWSIADRCGALIFDKTTLFSDAILTLKNLANEGVKLALVTNGASAPQRAKIEKFSLAQHFLHIQIEGEAGIGKPDLEAYNMAMKVLNVGAKETWMVGDNLDWEVVAPQELGIFSIWRDPHGDGTLPEGTDAKPDRIITRLSELVN
jgi:putative hydrolase of the HAD superfamily